MVYADDRRQKSLKEGKTPSVILFKSLASGKGAKIKFSAISLRKFYQSFIENGSLDKDFQVELMVDKVKFTDGSVWKTGDGKLNYVNAKFEKRAKLTSPKLLTPCAMQRCKAVSGREVNPPGAVTYTCETNTARETCINSADNYSCNNSACDRPGGGGSSGGFGFWDEYEYELDYGFGSW